MLRLLKQHPTSDKCDYSENHFLSPQHLIEQRSTLIFESLPGWQALQSQCRNPVGAGCAPIESSSGRSSPPTAVLDLSLSFLESCFPRSSSVNEAEPSFMWIVFHCSTLDRGPSCVWDNLDINVQCCSLKIPLFRFLCIDAQCEDTFPPFFQPKKFCFCRLIRFRTF